MRRVPWSLALSILCLGAFALRVFRLEYQSLWYDEAFSVYLAHFSLADITARTAADIQPPLYYYLLHFWMALAGDSEFAVRALSLFFGVLTIPLLYATGRRLFGAWSALAAALLGVLSPLYLWYSQEARMYTLITFLLLLSSYSLLRALEPQGGNASSVRAWWVVFALANIGAAYTHYFAFVVIAFQLVFALFAVFRAHPSAPATEQSLPRITSHREASQWDVSRITFYVKPLVLSLIAILAAFLPWAPFMVERLGQDASYWQGALKLDEAVRHIFINFTMGESVLEAQAQWIAVGWIVVLVVGIAAFAIYDVRFNPAKPAGSPPPPFHFGDLRLRSEISDLESGDRARRRLGAAFAVLYLVIPLALLLVLFYRNPKFNARYLMIASPGLFLLLGAGLASLLALARSKGIVTRALASLALLVAFAFLLGTSAYADNNAYFDPAFTKADFRGVARYLDDHLAPGEAIIMTSGHLFPALDYYYHGDAPQVRLPDDPTLNTDHVLGYDTANILNETVAGKKGVWVVLWQDEVVDPNGFVPLLLSSRGQEQKVDASFWQVKLRHWTLTPNAKFSPEPEPRVVRPANFKNEVQLLGFDAPQPTTADQGISFNLYWEALEPALGMPGSDYQVALRVQDAAGNLWGKQDRRPAGYNYPTSRWKKGEKLFGSYTVPLLAGAPAGDYFVQLTVYTGADQSGLDVLAPSGAPLGKSVKLGPIPVLPAAKPASYAALNIQNSVSAPLGAFTLLGYQLGRDKASAGESIPLTLFWRAETAPAQDYTFRVAFGDTLSDPLPLANEQYPTSHWRAGEIVRGQYAVSIPATAKAGTISLGLQLSDGTRLPDLAPFTIEKTDSVFVRPNMSFTQQASFGSAISLAGYNLSATTVKPGETLKATLVWQARGKTDKPYTIFVHLLDKDNNVVAQKDAEPLGGTRPTTGWVANEYLTDTFDLALKADVPAGEYHIEIGWYDAKDPAFARLPVLDENGVPAGDHVILKTAVTVKP
ncbi:MAG: glycosyltransferase family 39 protein [Chloroflexi bacterium]|nr:glycosyltransferase family 39 protein [Chloroflexota bacterium]